MDIMPSDFRTYKISRGEGEESYTLRLLLHIAPEGKFPEVDKKEVGEELELVFGERSVFISKSDHFYILRSTDFPHREDAEAFVGEVKAALFGFLLRKRIAIFTDELREIHTSDESRLYPGWDHPDGYDGWPAREDGSMIDG